jgi:two-component system chemotaxis response regulator CheB
MCDTKIRVVVVDDCRLLRQIIADALSEAPDVEIVGEASNGRHGLRMVRQLKPDVVTLDIQMPHMDGMTALEAILADGFTPVLMVSSHTRHGAEVTFDALARGALDYVAKPEGALARSAFSEELLRKVRMAAGADVHRILEIRKARAKRERKIPRPLTPVETKRSTVPRPAVDGCVAIGISTGGPPALTSLFESLQPPMPPIVIVQHMPPGFTGPFAWRLNSISPLSIKEAEEGDVLEPNLVLVAPGGRHVRLRRRAHQVVATLHDGPSVSGHRPSVDVMMQSAVECFGSRILGVIMTGMGRDGVAGCCAIRAAGGYVLGQDEATSEVYGMNKVAFVEGHVDEQFGLPSAAITISSHVRRTRRAAALTV